MKIFHNKRGEVPDFISDIFSFFLYLLVLLLFFILFSISFSGCSLFQSKTSTIMGDWNAKLGDEMLVQNYLRTNISARSETFAELIATSCQDNNFEELKAQTRALMARGLNGITLSTFEVRCDPASDSAVEFYRTELSATCKYSLQCGGDVVTGVDVPLLYSNPGRYAQVFTRKCVLPEAQQTGLSAQQKDTIMAELKRCMP